MWQAPTACKTTLLCRLQEKSATKDGCCLKCKARRRLPHEHAEKSIRRTMLSLQEKQWRSDKTGAVYEMLHGHRHSASVPDPGESQGRGSAGLVQVAAGGAG